MCLGHVVIIGAGLGGLATALRLSRSAYYGIPLHNFIGWFFVGMLIFSVVGQRRQMNRYARHVGLSIVLFFTAIAFSYGLILAGIIGLILCCVHSALDMPNAQIALRHCISPRR